MEQHYVYAADQGLQLQNETVDAIMYDDAAMLLLVFKGGVVFAYDLAVDVPAQHEQLVWTYPVQDGPPVLSARCSLDRRSLALQRSRVLVELVDLPTGNISVMHSDKGRSELLGMFLSEWPDAQLVLLSRAGLEMCTFEARRQGLHSRERLRLPVHWFQYSHETRCCMVATGPPLGPPYLQAWQFLASGLVTLPPFCVSAATLGTAPSGLPPSRTDSSVGPSSGAAGPAPSALRPSSANGPTTTAGAGNGQQATAVKHSRRDGQAGTPRSGPEPPLLPMSTPASVQDDQGSGARRNSGSCGQGRQYMSAAARPGGGRPTPEEPARKPRLMVGTLTSWLGGAAMAEAMGGAYGAMLGPPGITPPPLTTHWPDVSLAGSTTEAVPEPSTVRVLKLYGRVFCAHVNASTRRLDLYRMFTDTVVLQHSYDVPTTKLRLSVVDNVLVAHDPSACAAMLIDVAADPAHPVLPMRRLGHLAPLRRPRQLEEERLAQQQYQRQSRSSLPTGLGDAIPLGATVPPPTAWSVVDEEEGGLLPHIAWTYHLPNLVVDAKNQVVYRMLLDLHAISAECNSPAVLAAFLQRRRAPRLHVQHWDGYHKPAPAGAHGLAALRTTSLPTELSFTLPVIPDPNQERPGSPSASLNHTAVRSGASDGSLFGLGPTSGAAGGPGAVKGAGMRSSATSPLPPHHPMMFSGLINASAVASKLLVQHLAHRMLQEEVLLPLLREMFDAINKAYCEMALAATAGRGTLAAAACVLNPSELVVGVLDPMCRAPDLTPRRAKYLQAVVCELTTSLILMGIAPPTSLHPLRLQLQAWQPTPPHGAGPALHPPLPLLARWLHSTWNDLPPGVLPAESIDDRGVEGLRPYADAQLVRAARGPAEAAVTLPTSSPSTSATTAVAASSGNDSAGQFPEGGGGASASVTATGWVGALAGYVPGLSTVAATAGQAQAQAVTASGHAAGEVLVRRLLARGAVIRAARLAKELRVTSVTPEELVAAASKCADRRSVLTSVYRAFLPALLPKFPSLAALEEAVATAHLPAVPPAAG